MEPTSKWSINCQVFILALISNGVVHMNKQLWKLIVSPKIKNFKWYIRREVVITKDNLARWNWGGSKQCSFCLGDETIQHLFFYCLYARFHWGLVQITFNISSPQNIQDLFVTWAYQVGGKLKWQLLCVIPRSKKEGTKPSYVCP
jgi:hypothetical protein